jgi:pyruvate dehydrogenase E2 component (dihydrolipoamide acetyltransferase)
MPWLLRMPEVAANAVEAVLQEWQVEENATFSEADTLATVETEKAVVDVEAESDGVLLRTLVPNGAQVAVGAPIALLGDAGDSADGDLDAVMARLGVTANGAVVTPERREVPDLSGAEDGVDGTPAEEAEARTDPPVPVGGANGGRVFASPLARRLARDAGLDLAVLSGTGPRGRILRRDVEAVSSSAEAAVRPVAEQAASPAVPRPAVPQAAPVAGSTDVPHSRMRRAIATRLTQSKHTVPHFYLRATIRVDELLRVRAQLNDSAPVRISLNDLVVKAAARAHALVPAMNVIWTEDAVRSFSSVDIALAVATDGGLLTPVVRGVDGMSVSTLARTTRDLADRAKAGRLRQEELEGGSMSVTNLGKFGTEEFAAIINPPQSAILAVGAVRQEPVVEDGGLAVGAVMRVTLSVDHRPVDGVVAAEWMRVFVSLMEQPVQILA